MDEEIADMDKIRMKIFSLGDYSVNCYLLFYRDSKEAIIIDAPGGIEKVLKFANDNDLKLSAFVLTHGHFDHICGLNSSTLPFYIYPEDEQFLYNPKLNLSSLVGKPLKVKKKPLLLSEGVVKVGPFEIEVLHTPGHTPGSVSLRLKNWLFCGDTLFFNSVGRTDFAYCSHERLIDSIKRKILSLDGGVSVFPGHGPSTTVKREKENNRFFI